MTEPVICTPLRVEQAAVLRGGPGLPVIRTGRGPRRSQAAVGRFGLTGRPLAVAGLAGAVAPGLYPGDLVLATEVRATEVRAGDTESIALPAAPLLATALRRRGLTVRLGPIQSTAAIVHGRDRAGYAAEQVLAVDMESAQLVQAAAGQPAMVLRAVVDTPEHPLLRAGTAGRGLRALRALATAAPVLAQWQLALGPREVLLAEPRSFCAGVSRAVDIVERALRQYPAPVYVRRQIVHNAHVVRRLEQLGAVFVTELAEVPRNATVVLAAHGVAPEVYRQAAERDLQVVDATCPLVAKVHSEIRRYAARGDTVLLIGHSQHEEVVGSRGQAPDQVIVIADLKQAETVSPVDENRVSYAMQTTLAVEEADEIAAVLRERFPGITGPARQDICYASSNRQQAVRAVAADTDLVLVLGSANSSNSQRLVEVAERAGTTAYLVEDAEHIDLDWLISARRIGLTAGASAPAELLDEVLGALTGLGPVAAGTTSVTEERVQFSLPKEVS